jgi:hypothetical protein
MADNTGLIIIIVVVIICSCCVSSSIAGGMGYIQMNKKDTEKDTEEESATVVNPAPTTKAAAAATTPAAAPPKPQFTLNPKFNTTGWNEIGGTIYLDRHHVDCKQGAAINNFKLDTLGNRMQYVYQCSENKNLGPETGKVNPGSEANQYFYLDRQNINCGENEVMSHFVLHNVGNGNWGYGVKCQKASNPLTCRDVETPPTEIGKDHTTLKSHPVKCERDEALNSFQLNSWKDGQAKTYYKYKCCK